MSDERASAIELLGFLTIAALDGSAHRMQTGEPEVDSVQNFLNMEAVSEAIFGRMGIDPWDWINADDEERVRLITDMED